VSTYFPSLTLDSSTARWYSRDFGLSLVSTEDAICAFVSRSVRTLAILDDKNNKAPMVVMVPSGDRALVRV